MYEKSKPAKSKTPRKITEHSLRNVALHYLQRYASSKENLKRVLKRRVMRSAQFHVDLDTEEASQWIESLVEQLAQTGLVDDRTYAEGRVRALFRRGVSPNGISQRLNQKGVDAALIQEVIAELYRETSDPNLMAAIKLVKRRRLGPYRLPEKREERRDKDLAAVARAGFDFQTARKVIYAQSTEELDEMVSSD
ncbi:MAG: regulatory protein RecX [Rhodospirillales bacterium]|nr:regulatory protein RecX [Rhodospirillales bacterium]